MLKFADFEWAAFLYWAVSYGGNIGGDQDYIPLMSDNMFLKCLRENPEDLTLKEIRDKVILFLNRWKCRIKDDNEIAEAIKQALIRSKDTLHNIQGTSLLNIDMLSETKRDQIIEIYSEIDDIRYFSLTAISKTMHILKPDLFVMWDNSILEHYRSENHQVAPTGHGYFTFLAMISRLAREVTDDFHRFHSGSTPESYLCEKLGYQLNKSIAKFIDEYNWITFTKKLSIPLRWWPGISI